MGLPVGTPDFYAGLPIVNGFGRITDLGVYRPVPDGWFIAVTDIVDSTRAIGAGRYKVVNTAGAAMIAAIANALPGRDFPSVFGGDGAAAVVPPEAEAVVRKVLADTAAWVREDLGLTLRAAMIPVAAVRQAGRDLLVARFAASPDVSYAMFSGGGLAWAEGELKRGAFAVEPGPPGVRPDLTGLSCRWEEIPARRGVLLSLIVTPTAGESEPFRELIAEILALGSSADAGRPEPEVARNMRWPPTGLDVEMRATGNRNHPLWLRRLRLAAVALFSYLVVRLGLRLGSFDTATYLRQLVENTDFRKYDDGLRMTLDCTLRLADRIETLLSDAASRGIARYGLHRQDSALMTCIVPSPTRSDHIHFVDGAAGGYAAAAMSLKAAS
jgi:hypothetical protein